MILGVGCRYSGSDLSVVIIARYARPGYVPELGLTFASSSVESMSGVASILSNLEAAWQMWRHIYGCR